MVLSQSGRTMIETLAVLIFVGLFSVMGLQLYARAMNTIRSNYLMEQMYIKVTEYARESHRHGKMFDISMNDKKDEYGNIKLSYGFSIVKQEAEYVSYSADGKELSVRLAGNFPVGICKSFVKKMRTNEYPGLAKVRMGGNDINKESDCSEINDSVTFTLDSQFRRVKFVSKNVEQTGGSNGHGGYVAAVIEPCKPHAISCSPLICDEEAGYFEFEGEEGKCQPCPAGYYCV